MEYLTINDCFEEDLLKIIIENSNPDENENSLKFIPVVDNSTNMNLMYTVKTSDLYAYCEIVYGSLKGKTISDASILQ